MLKTPKGVHPGLPFLPPAKNPWLLRFAPLGSWLYVRFGNRVRREEIHDIERLVRTYQEMQDGKTRLIVAFRHAGVEDGTVVFRLMSGIVGREARRLGIRLRWPPRGYFLFGRDVPEWAGHFLEWMLPLLGAIAVYPGRYDSRSIATLRRYLTDMPHPVSLAPEGQVTYHNERVAALEAGTAQLGFWCMEDLKKQSRTEDVVIVPVCTSYHYNPRDWKGLLRLLERTEEECGLLPLEGLSPRGEGRYSMPPDEAAREKIHVRVMRVTRRILDIAEDFYSRFFDISFPERKEEETTHDLQNRLHGVCDAALTVVERFFHVKQKGDFVQRVFAVRQAGLAWMHRDDIPDPERLSPVDRALADRIAQESWLCLRHMELVDVLEYVRADYLKPDSDFDRFVESITDLWDVLNRLKGGNISGRINPFRKTARIIVNEPIRVSPLWALYKENRRKAVAALTQTIFESFRAVAENGNRPVV
ncbi:MAG: hypothetical protein ABSF77_04030 [Spirochaetia bacterium]